MSGRRPHMRGTLGHPGANGWDRLMSLADQIHAQQARRATAEQADPGQERMPTPAPGRKPRAKRHRR